MICANVGNVVSFVSELNSAILDIRKSQAGELPVQQLKAEARLEVCTKLIKENSLLAIIYFCQNLTTLPVVDLL